VAGTIQMVGPGLIALIALAVLIWAFSGYVTFDSFRRRKTDYAGVIEGRWFYTVPQALFFIVFVAWQVPWVQTNASWIGNLLIAIPFILAQQMAYLLRVVYPTSKRLEKRLDAECALMRESGHDAWTPGDAPAPARAVPADEPATEPEDDGFFDPDDPDA
jgi:hypothetical protein